ncbi:hypothetical protein SK355_04125 [Candidatus Fukatsuia symbiotica]|nr:hypothetical protein [Candidatus Fukatsuia symbiotica]MEA9444493.1 hypothetical protein [Candidatus Fukatsuia symbiotica]
MLNNTRGARLPPTEAATQERNIRTDEVWFSVSAIWCWNINSKIYNFLNEYTLQGIRKMTMSWG